MNPILATVPWSDALTGISKAAENTNSGVASDVNMFNKALYPPGVYFSQVCFLWASSATDARPWQRSEIAHYIQAWDASEVIRD